MFLGHSGRAEPKEVKVNEDLLYNAKSVILAHNHPSGDPKPSQEDIETTRLFSKTLAGLDIMVIDHIVIGKNDFSSLKQMGIFPDTAKVSEKRSVYHAGSLSDLSIPKPHSKRLDDSASR